MIGDFPGVNDPMKLKVLVHDAAANMKKAGKQDSNKVYESMVCIDHLLNTSLGHAEARTEEVAELFKKCKALATRTHQSTNDWFTIKKFCEKVNIKPMKITQPVSTRWNSNCMMLESLVRMQPALEQIVLDQNVRKELQDLIPHDYEFVMIKKLFKYLNVIRGYSEKWSSQKEVSIACVLSDLYTISEFTKDRIRSYKNHDGQISDFLEAFLEELQMHNAQTQRLKNLGMENKIYRIAHYLHPYYKGCAMKRQILDNGQDAFQFTEQDLIEKHPSTARYKFLFHFQEILILSNRIKPLKSFFFNKISKKSFFF
jgi:hypothetical protein